MKKSFGVGIMKIKEITKFFIIGSILIIFAYDGYAYLSHGQEATVSYIVITEWSRDYPAFTFMIGFIMGHLFWPLYRERK
jgi:hypothetical protein